MTALVRETGWSHTQFAWAVNRVGAERGDSLRYDQSAVCHWLHGTMPRARVRPLLLEALARRLNRPVTESAAGFPTAPDTGPGPSGIPTVESLVDLGSHDMDPSRRGVLGVGLFSVALTIPGWPDVVGRAEAVQSGRARRIGQGEVDTVVAMTERISDLDDEFGGRHARPMAAAFLVNTVAPYLRADAPEAVRKSALSAAAYLSFLAGYMAVDEGHHGLAQRYYVKSLELAGAADNHLTYCATLRGMSVQAINLRHDRLSLELADAAAEAAPQAGPRVRALLSGQQAHAAARAGDRPGALRLIRETEASLDRAESREGRTFTSYDPAALNYHIAEIRHEFGDPHGSVEALQEAERLRNSNHRRTRVHRGGLLAERQLGVGHLEAACATWNRALDEYPHVQSGRADERVVDAVRLLRPYLKNPVARAVHDRARALAPSGPNAPNGRGGVTGLL
ncbi:Tat pathway signal protein [Streptomyces daliensis]